MYFILIFHCLTSACSVSAQDAVSLQECLVTYLRFPGDVAALLDQRSHHLQSAVTRGYMHSGLSVLMREENTVSVPCYRTSSITVWPNDAPFWRPPALRSHPRRSSEASQPLSHRPSLSLRCAEGFPAPEYRTHTRTKGLLSFPVDPAYIPTTFLNFLRRNHFFSCTDTFSILSNH